MVTKAQKIFVEPDEEIVFTLEKIKNASAARAILVVPQNAALVSSGVSLKILSRELLDTDKMAVMVSDNDTGLRLAEKAGMVAVRKISEVNKEIWRQVKETKEAQLASRERIKQELLGERKEDDHTQTAEIKGNKVKAEIEDTPETASVEVKHATKPRLESKVVEIGGITVVAGGDIMDHPDILDKEMSKLLNEPDAQNFFEENSVKQVLFKNQEKNINELREKAGTLTANDPVQMKAPKDKSLIGRDIAAMMPAGTEPKGRTNRQAIPSSFDKFKVRAKDFTDKFTRGGNKKRAFQIGIALFILFFLVSYLFLPFVSITLVFAESKVRVNETVVAAASIEEIDVDNLKLPATNISKTATLTKEMAATGQGEKGEIAKGVVDVYNNTDQPVTIEAGVLIENISTNLKYKITQKITVPPTSTKPDVAIEAEKFGENYNIINQQKFFKVPNFNTTDVSARNFRDITGGTTEKVTVVSKEDIEAVKAALADELKTQLAESLNSLISDEDILLTGSEQFKEEEFKTTVEENKEAEKFSGEMKMTISAISVRKGDLIEIAREIIRRQENGSDQASINVSDPVIRNIRINEAREATFELSSNAGVTADVDSEQLKKDIAGMNVNDARDFLRRIEGVSEYKLKYTPIYIPFFLQRVPSDPAKIVIEKTFEDNAE